MRFFGAENAAAGATEGLKSVEACAPPLTAFKLDSFAKALMPALLRTRMHGLGSARRRDGEPGRRRGAGRLGGTRSTSSGRLFARVLTRSPRRAGAAVPGADVAIGGLVGDAAETRETTAASFYA